ncbi:MAG TPA: family 16 glycosylhydrolase [Prolixibacteraceae bacterium]
MKGFILTLIGLVLIGGSIYSQTFDRRYNPKYMWTTLDENFSKPTLDRSVWNPSTHFKRGLGFLVDSVITIKVNDGKLELKMQHTPHYLDSIWRSRGWEPIYSDYIGGEVVSLQKFSYGVFECRARYALKSGSWPAFWLIGNDGTPCPPGGHGSEIDIAELSAASDFPTMMHVIHNYDPPVNCNEANAMGKDEKSYSVSRRQKYVTYKCVWTPQRIQYFINDKLKHEVINQGYDWFPSVPLNLILSQQVTQGYDMAREIKPVTPQTSYFDWVKVRQYFLAPEITCPDAIPTEGTATLDVDPLATKVSWQLTPAQLFTTSDGTGKTAHIVRAANANGQGKITYTFQMPSGEVFTAEKTFD